MILGMPDRPSALPTILLVDDDPAVAQTLAAILRESGSSEVQHCGDGVEALAAIERGPPALVLLDLRMPRGDGETLLVTLQQRWPAIPVVVVTGEAEVGTAVRCMKLGAADYLLKPIHGELLLATVARCLEGIELRREAERLRRGFFDGGPVRTPAFRPILTQDRGMQRLFHFIEAIARSSQPVLIRGETGTGKELVARALHECGRAGKPFIAVNVAGLDDALVADALFGHVAGSFTGSVGARTGLIGSAEDGTLFLDEIGDLSPASQVKLLRLIQEREYHPVGSDSPRPLRARIVAATHRDPRELREDLYYRLRFYEACIPALRERRGDLEPLFRHFVERAARDLGREPPRVPEEVFVHLRDQPFPGNVRQLEGLAHAVVARCGGETLQVEQVLEVLGAGGAPAPAEAAGAGAIAFPEPMPSMTEIERSAVAEALRRCSGNQSAAARMLGLSRPTIARLGRQPAEPGTPHAD